MSTTEVYPNAPVVLVAFEVRHPGTDAVTPNEVRAIKSRLAQYAPIARNAQATSVAVVPGMSVQPSPTHEAFPRLISRDSTLAVSFRKESLVVETSAYPGWDTFREVIGAAVAARMDLAPIDAYDRLGLRYIDEIRVPQDASDWSGWINPSLLGPKPSTSIDLPLAQWQGIAIFGQQPGHTLVVRSGPQVGFAVDPSSELRRVKPSDPGQFFLMDIDSYWTPEGGFPEVDLEQLLAMCDQLHAPIRTLFEGLITDKLRDEVFRSND